MSRLRTLTVGVALMALFATGCDWHFETLDGPGGRPGSSTESQGYFSSAIVYNGNPHVFYAGHANGTNWVLRHAYWNGIAWAFETLDGSTSPRPGHTNNHVGRPSAALVYNGRPHIFYDDETDDVLRHAYWNGVAWAFEVLDGAGGGGGRTTHDVGKATTTLLYNARPHVFYYDDTDKSLRHAYYNGVAWAFETLDGTGSTRPGHTLNEVGTHSAAVVYNGRPHVFYDDITDTSLRHAYWNGVAWAFEALDGPGSTVPGHTVNAVGQYPAVVLYDARPHVFYQDAANKALRHAYYNGMAWAFEALDGPGSTLPGHTNNNVGYEAAATIYGGKPQVFHGGAVPDTLRRAYWNGTAWILETIDGVGGLPGSTNDAVGYNNSVVVTGGDVHVFTRDITGTNTLRHVWFG